jgi:hypothetical protein
VSIDTTKTILAEDVEAGFELDLDGDEYGDNELAVYGYATVERRSDWWDGQSGEPMVTLYTTQGEFEMPAGHTVKIRVQ